MYGSITISFSHITKHVSVFLKCYDVIIQIVHFWGRKFAQFQHKYFFSELYNWVPVISEKLITFAVPFWPMTLCLGSSRSSLATSITRPQTGHYRNRGLQKWKQCTRMLTLPFATQHSLPQFLLKEELVRTTKMLNFPKSSFKQIITYCKIGHLYYKNNIIKEWKYG